MKINNLAIVDSMAKLKSVFYQYADKNIAISVSGGADSDIVIDLAHQSLKKEQLRTIKYVFFDTGLEYNATKEHLVYLEGKYDIKIDIYKPLSPIPKTIREAGNPFISKYVSAMISRLQRHNFNFATANNYTFEQQIIRYPRAKGALRWFYNANAKEDSHFQIKKVKLLREFLISNPPPPISDKCCDEAKKKVAKKYCSDFKIDLMLTGIRKAEAGIRSVAYKRCVYKYDDKTDLYMPILWYTDDDKKEYEKIFNVTHSRCYTEYGLKRTGCVACPFGSKYKDELALIKEKEPLLHKASSHVFRDGYAYKEKYLEFKENNKET